MALFTFNKWQIEKNLLGQCQALAKSILGPSFTCVVNRRGFSGGEEENTAAIPRNGGYSC